MSTNFAGLGFSFFAKDGGLSNTLQSIAAKMDSTATGIRGFTAAAEGATQPIDNFVQSLGGQAFEGAITSAERVSDAISTGIVGSVVKGTQVMETARGVFSEGGGEISTSFSNLKNSVKGFYQQLAGDRLAKFAAQLPTERFKAIGDQMKSTVGVARGFVGQLFGLKKGFTEVGKGAGEAAKPLQHVVSDETAAQMGRVDGQVAKLSDNLGRKLPKSAGNAAEKFKRSSNEIAGGESKISRGFNDISRSADKSGSAMERAASLGKKFLNALPAKKLMGVAQAVANVGTSGGQLTTGFEAAAQAASVDGRKAVAAYGIFGQALNKASGEAAGLIMGMKTSGQTAGAAVASFKQYGTVLKAVGIDSAAAGVKLEDGMGIPIRDVTMQLHRMQTNLKLSDAELGDLTKTFTGAGETIGDMKAPFGRMDEMLAIAERRSNLVASGMSSIGGKDSIKSLNRATQSLFILTGNAKGAQDTALSLENTMAGAMEGFQKMFTGNNDELDKFLVGTSIVTGDVEQAFKAAADGPDAFIKKFGGVIAQLKKSGKKTEDIMKFFGGQMSSAMDPEAANQLVTALGNIDDEKLKLMNSTKAMGKSLGELGKESWRSSMTMQESFDLMMGSAESRFRNIGRAAAVTFMGDTKKAFDTFNTSAEKLVKEGGPLGAMVNKMSEISSLGAKALLPEALRPMAQIFGHLGPEVFSAVSAFASLAPVLLGLLNPVTVLLGAFTLMHLGFKQTEARLKSQDKAYQDVSKSIKGYEKQLTKLKKGSTEFKKVEEQLGAEKKKQHEMDRVIAAASKKEFVKTVKAKFDQYSKQAIEFIKTIPGYAKEFATEFKEMFAAINWKSLWTSVTGMFNKGISFLFDEVDWSGLWASISDSVESVDWAGILTTMVDAMMKGRAFIITKFVALMNAVMDGLSQIDWDRVGEILKKGFTLALGKASQGFGALVQILQSKVLPLLVRVFDMVIEAAVSLPSRLGKILSSLGPVVGAALKSVIPIVLDLLKGLLVAAAGLIWKLVQRMPDILMGLGDLLKGALDFVRDVIIGVMQGVRDWLIQQFPSLAGPIMSVFTTIETAYRGMYDGIKYIIDLVLGVVTGFQREAIAMWDSIFSGSAVSGAASALAPVIGFFQTIWKVLSAIGTVIAGVLIPWWNVLWSVVKFVANNIWSALRLIVQPLETIAYVIYRVVVLAFKVMWGVISTGVQLVAGLLGWLWTNVWQPTWTMMANLVMDVWTKYIKPVWDPVAKFFADIFDKVAGYVTGATDTIVGGWQTVRNKVGEFFDWIENIVDKFFGHSIVPDAFKAGFDVINKVVDGFWEFFKGIFDKVSSLLATLFAPVTKIVDKIFGGGGDSIGNMIAGGMDKALSVIKDVVASVTQLVQKSLYEAIVQGLTDAFVMAFQLVTKSTTKFFELQTAAFKKFLEGILNMFRSGWIRILDDTDRASQAVSSTIAGSLADLEKLKSALVAAQQARAAAAAAAAEGTKAGEPIKAETDADKYKQQILQQTSMPDWYTKNYSGQFDAGIDRIVDAVKGIKVSASGPGNRSAAAVEASRLRSPGDSGATNITGIQVNK